MKCDPLIPLLTLGLTVWGVVERTRLMGLDAGANVQALVPVAIGMAGALLAFLVCGRDRLGRIVRGRGGWFCWGAAVAVLAGLIVFGRTYRGGVYLPGRINPSECVKLGLVLFAGGFLARERLGICAMLVFGGAVGGLCALAAGAGDMGLVAQLALTTGCLLFSVSWVWGTLSLVLLVTGIAGVLAHPFGHLATRVAVWQDPLADATGAGWQTLQALAAVVSGGWKGVGLGLGEVHAIPIASSDFIYAAMAEELGFAGCAVLLLAWGFLLLRGLCAALRRVPEDRAGAYVAVGLVASLSVQLLLNVAGVLNVVPMTGITLPLISQGGCSLVVTLVMCGLLAGLSRAT